LPYVDLNHCNEREALANTGVPTLDDAVGEFLSAGAQLVLVTDGPQGARAFTDDREVAQGGLRVDTIDVTGCGDAFCAGAIDVLDEHDSPPLGDLGPGRLAEILIRAQAVGESAATAIGCVEGVSAPMADGILAKQRCKVRQTTESKKRHRGGEEA